MERLYYLLALVFLPVLALHAAKRENTWDDGYRAYQDIAPEYLEISISKVEIKDGASMFGSSSKVEVQAEVTQVFRSASALKQGSRIVIAYTRKSAAGTNTLEPSIPKEGETVPAFLRKKGNRYEPAALHHTFDALTPQQLIVLGKSGSAKPATPAESVKDPTPPRMIVTAPEPEELPQEPRRPQPEPVVAEPITIKPQPDPEPVKPQSVAVAEPPKSQPVPEATPKPTPEPVKIASQPEKPRKYTPPIVVTRPIVVTKPEPAPDPQPPVAVIADPLPARQPEPKVTPQPPKPEPIVVQTVETAPPATEPIVIKKVDPTPTPKPTQKPTPSPKPERPAPPLLTATQAPAAVAPPAPASAPFDQEGLSAYASIYAKIKEGDRAADSHETATALKIYKETLMDLEKLKVSKPDFQPFIVEYRQKDLARKISALEAEPKK
jgi:hypothetical protein